MKKFKTQHEPILDENDAKVADIQTFEREINNTLSGMEERLDHLEKEISQVR